MSKVFGPLFGVDAKGTFAKALTFQGRPNGTAVIKPPRASKKSLENPSLAQSVQRATIARLIAQWQAMTVAEKEIWNLAAKGEWSNLLADGDMEAPNTDAWNFVYNDATISKQTKNPHSGARCMRVVRAEKEYALFCQTGAGKTVAGKIYWATGWARGDGLSIPVVLPGGPDVWIGTPSTEWQYFDFVACPKYAGFYFCTTLGNPGNYTEYDDVRVVDFIPGFAPKKTQISGYHFYIQQAQILKL